MAPMLESPLVGVTARSMPGELPKRLVYSSTAASLLRLQPSTA